MGVSIKAVKFSTLLAILQVAFMIIIGVLGKYNRTTPTTTSTTPNLSYQNFQDVNVMIFMGFGFLMTFLKCYGYSAVGLNLFISAVCIEWAFIVRGFIHSDILGGQRFAIGVDQMVTSNFAAATVLISFGAVLGKTSPIQLLVMGIFEVLFAQINEYIGFDILKTVDVGESMFIHMFGAYFGLAVSRVLYSQDAEDNPAEGSVYHSDLFSMIGTIFLWIYWPSFNGGFAGANSEIAFVNTFLSLCACTAMTFALSGLLDDKGRFDMVHIQNSTLAGGVAVGACANMPMDPYLAMIIGSLAGVVSVLGYKYLSPWMRSKLKIQDTCGVHNLHGMPGLLAAIFTAIIVAASDWGQSDTESVYGGELSRSVKVQAGYQMLAAVVTLGIAIVGGTITGFILKLPIWNAPVEEEMYHDACNWELPENGLPIEGNKYKPPNDNCDTHM